MSLLIYRLTDEGLARVVDGGLDLRVLDVGLPDFAIPIFPQTGTGDISTIWQDGLGHADWQQVGRFLQSGDDLDTALLISLFSDRTAAADDAIPDGTNDRRGWWGDIGEDYPIGSRIWLLDRAKLDAATPLKCQDYITEATQWMLDDGVAAAIKVSAQVILPVTLVATVAILRQDGVRKASNFAWVWKKVG